MPHLCFFAEIMILEALFLAYSKWKTDSTSDIITRGFCSMRSRLLRSLKRAFIFLFSLETDLPPLIRRVRVLTTSNVSFGQIPPEHWYQPEWIDETRASAGRQKMMQQGIIYAGKCLSFMKISSALYLS